MGRKRREDDGLPRIPLCHACHMALHHGNQALEMIVIARAPAHWKRQGEWEQARPIYETYLARRQYLEDIR